MAEQRFDTLTGEVDEKTPVEIAQEEDPTRYREATEREVVRAEGQRRFGDETGLALAEMSVPGLRYARRELGLDTEENQRERAAFVSSEHPTSSVATPLAAQIALAMVGGSVAGAAAKAASIPQVGGRLIAGAAEGLLGGALGEAERAFLEDEDFNIGNMVAFGLGGELLGRGAAALIGKAGRGAANLLARSEARAVGASVEEAIASRAPKALAQHADEIVKRATGEFDDAARGLREAFELARPAVPDIPDAPVQFEWAADAARQALDGAVDLPRKQAARVAELATDLASVTKGRQIWEKADELVRALPPESPARAAIIEGLGRDDIWTPPVANARRAYDAAAARAQAGALDLTDPNVLDTIAGYQDVAQAALDGRGLKAADKARAAVELARATEAARTPKGFIDEVLGGEAGKGLAEAAVTGVAYAVHPALGAAVQGGGRYFRALKSITGGSAAVRERAARLLATGSRAAAPVGRAARAAAGPVATSALQRFSEDYPSPEAAYSARRDSLVALERDPLAWATEVASGLGDLPAEHPEIFQQIVARTVQGAQYLKSQLPAGIVRSLRSPNGLPPGRDEIARFAAVWEAVTYPARTIEALGEGKARPEAVQALKAVHPDMFAQLQGAVIREIALSTAPIPTETKIRLDLLLDLDGAATPALSWATAASAQSGAEKRAKTAGAGGQVSGVGPQDARQLGAIASGPTSGGGR
jgi:hypothetical protein